MQPSIDSTAVILQSAQAFMTLISDEGYSNRSQNFYRRISEHTVSLLIDNNTQLTALTEPCAATFKDQVLNLVNKSSRQHAAYCFERFRAFLIQNYQAPPREVVTIAQTPRTQLKQVYRSYLKEQRGLADSTIAHCLSFYERFMTFKFGNDIGDLNTINASDITQFMLALRTKRGQPYRVKTVPSHLRSFFNFLFWSGHTQLNLAESILSQRQPKTATIPRYLAPEKVDQLLESAKASGKNGVRNYALLLLAARLGLRAPEVAAVRLDDIDWRQGTIMVRGKGQLHDNMPLPTEVGEAIANYARIRPRSQARQLFVSCRAPFRAFKDGQIITYILKQAYQKTGIQPPQAYIGSHILRHSLATDLLNKGASLEEIGDVLRHRSRMTTTIYAQYDVEALRSLAQSWPTTGAE